MDPYVIRLQDVSKSYGKVKAVDNVTLNIPEGSVFALLGRNGAGKTTTLRMLAGLMKPDEGSIRVFGEDPWSLRAETRRRIGYVSEQDFPFPDLTFEAAANLCAGLSPRWDAAYFEKLQQGLNFDKKRKVGNYSKGEQRMITLLVTLAAKPDLVILDDPAIGLDAAARRGFLTAVLTLLREEGKTVLFSSHILTDVERIADRVAFIDQGRIHFDRPLDDLKSRIKRVTMSWDGAPPAEIRIDGKIREIRKGSEILLTLDDCTEEKQRHMRETLGARIAVQDLPLEEIFIDFYSRTT